MSRSVGKCWVLFLCIWEMIRSGGDWLSHCIVKSRLFPTFQKRHWLRNQRIQYMFYKYISIVDYGSTGLSVARWKKITSAFKQLVDNLHLHSLDAFAPGECGGYSMTTTPWLWSLFSKRMDTGYYTFLFAIERVLICIDVLGLFIPLYRSPKLLPAESSTECWQLSQEFQAAKARVNRRAVRENREVPAEGTAMEQQAALSAYGTEAGPKQLTLGRNSGPGNGYSTRADSVEDGTMLRTRLRSQNVILWVESEAQILPYSFLI